MESISLDAAAAMTGKGRRTLYRQIAEGKMAKQPKDARGRSMIALAEVVDLVGFPLDDDDLAMIVRADSGDAEAQDDVGQMFYAAGAFDAAIYWLREAAAQEHPDAMQWLGTCYAAGQGVPKDVNLSVMWIAKAAAHGHAIAEHQIRSMLTT